MPLTRARLAVFAGARYRAVTDAIRKDERHDGATADGVAVSPMENKLLPLLVTVGFSLVGVVGDYFLKLASAQEHSLRTPWFCAGFAVYASTAFD